MMSVVWLHAEDALQDHFHYEVNSDGMIGKGELHPMFKSLGIHDKCVFATDSMVLMCSVRASVHGFSVNMVCMVLIE